jgi:hypothetical protein
MRVRAVVAIVLLLLPAGLTAQRIPLPRVLGRGPARPTPLPPQPPGIARELAYKRLRLSVETYPLVTYIDAPTFTGDGGVSSWTSFGMGTRTDYRITRHLSATLDMTSSFLGGPAVTHTAEIGTRLRPERSERRVYPFVDVRVGYIYSYNSTFRPFDVDGYGTTLPVASGGRYSEGLGGAGGVGMEYSLTRRFSLTTAASVLRSRMTAHERRASGTTNQRFWMMSYRYSLGVRYNPVRLIQMPTSSP